MKEITHSSKRYSNYAGGAIILATLFLCIEIPYIPEGVSVVVAVILIIGAGHMYSQNIERRKFIPIVLSTVIVVAIVALIAFGIIQF